MAEDLSLSSRHGRLLNAVSCHLTFETSSDRKGSVAASGLKNLNDCFQSDPAVDPNTGCRAATRRVAGGLAKAPAGAEGSSFECTALFDKGRSEVRPSAATSNAARTPEYCMANHLLCERQQAIRLIYRLRSWLAPDRVNRIVRRPSAWKGAKGRRPVCPTGATPCRRPPSSLR